MEPVERIRYLTKFLPKDDVGLANDFINSRDFESLQEIVDSAIIKVKRNLSSNNPKEKYINLDIDELTMLKAEVDVYVEQLQLPYYQEDEFEDYEEEY